MACDLCGLGTKVVSTDVGEAGNWSKAEQEIELLPVADVNKRVVRAMREFRQGMHDPFVLVMGWRAYVQAEHAHACTARMMDGPRNDARFRLFGVDVLLDPRTMRDEVRVLAKPDVELLRSVAATEGNDEPTEPEKAEVYHSTAENLWHLLDNIDTLDDACKDDDAAFRKAVRKQLVHQDMLPCYDGHTLSWPWDPKPKPAEPDTPNEG